MTSDLQLPTNPDDLTCDLLNGLLEQRAPALRIRDFVVREAHQVGLGEASSAGRICIDVEYADRPPEGAPNALVLKVAKSAESDPSRPDPIAGAGGALYRNELAIYREVDPARFLEAPKFFGGAYDRQPNSLVLILEDLRAREVTFPHVTVPTSLERMESLLDQLARLHARYWNSPDLKTASGWLQAHTRGEIHEQFASPHVLPPHLQRELETEQFKREMVERLGGTPDALFRQVHAVQRHQAGLPQTLCHGDTHIGNTYALPGEKGGLYDWQLASQGFALHDISYVLATGLSIAQRRENERELLALYRERLLAHGATDVPALEALWNEYRRAMIWGVYIGWLITPRINYGWEITVMAHLRMMTAYEDLETAKLIAALD